MEQQIVEIVVKVVVALLGLGGLYLIRRVKLWLDARTDTDDVAFLDTIIEQLVAAAEQQLKADDPDGSKRKQYVVDGLADLGHELTGIWNAKIEAAVYRLNKGGGE